MPLPPPTLLPLPPPPPLPPQAGLLSSLTSTFTDLGLDVVRADIGGGGGVFRDQFWVTTAEGTQVGGADLAAVQAALELTLASAAKQAVASRPKLSVPGATEDRQELLHTLMDTYVKNDVLSIQQSIVNRECRRGGGGACRMRAVRARCRWRRAACWHAVPPPCCPPWWPPASLLRPSLTPPSHCPPTAPSTPPCLPCLLLPADVEYTMARSRYKFDDLEAYMATAYSVRDRLIEEWNDTQ